MALACLSKNEVEGGELTCEARSLNYIQNRNLNSCLVVAIWINKVIVTNSIATIVSPMLIGYMLKTKKFITCLRDLRIVFQN